MSILSKTLKLRTPFNIIYRALKETRLKILIPEFFIGVERKVIRYNKKKKSPLTGQLKENRLKLLTFNTFK